MRKTIDRQYVLSADEAQSAIGRYLREICDQPDPDDYKDLKIAWNANGDVFVSFTEINQAAA